MSSSTSRQAINSFDLYMVSISHGHQKTFVLSQCVFKSVQPAMLSYMNDVLTVLEEGEIYSGGTILSGLRFDSDDCAYSPSISTSFVMDGDLLDKYIQDFHAGSKDAAIEALKNVDSIDWDKLQALFRPATEKDIE
jgi:hypothetical protein